MLPLLLMMLVWRLLRLLLLLLLGWNLRHSTLIHPQSFRIHDPSSSRSRPAAARGLSICHVRQGRPFPVGILMSHRPAAAGQWWTVRRCGGPIPGIKVWTGQGSIRRRRRRASIHHGAADIVAPGGPDLPVHVLRRVDEVPRRRRGVATGRGRCVVVASG